MHVFQCVDECEFAFHKNALFQLDGHMQGRSHLPPIRPLVKARSNNGVIHEIASVAHTIKPGECPFTVQDAVIKVSLKIRQGKMRSEELYQNIFSCLLFKKKTKKKKRERERLGGGGTHLIYMTSDKARATLAVEDGVGYVPLVCFTHKPTQTRFICHGC